jgi:hypothetical protein
MTLFHGIFSAPSWQSLTYLAYGWSLAWGRQTITTYLWLSGATTVKHFSRYYVFLGGPLYTVRNRLWAQVIRCGASFIPDGEVINPHVDDHTAKSLADTSKDARYRTEPVVPGKNTHPCGMNLVLASCVFLTRWPGHASASPLA